MEDSWREIRSLIRARSPHKGVRKPERPARTLVAFGELHAQLTTGQIRCNAPNPGAMHQNWVFIPKTNGSKLGGFPHKGDINRFEETIETNPGESDRQVPDRRE